MSQPASYRIASPTDINAAAPEHLPDPGRTPPEDIRAWHLATTPRSHGAPYRTEPRTASEDVIDALNKAEGNEHSQRYEPAEAAKKRIRKQVSANPARVRSWTRHPDETVVLELLNKHGWVRQNERMQKTFVEAERDLVSEEVGRRALADAKHEGVVWTPLLDHFASGRFWSPRHVWDGPDIEEHIAELRPWLEARMDPRALESLLDFGCSELVRFVLKNAPVVDQGLVDIASEKHPSELCMLVGNPNLPDPVAGKLVSQSADVLASVDQRAYAGDVPASIRVLQAATKADHELPDDLRERALGALRRVAEERDGKLTFVATRVLDVLLQTDGLLDEENLLQMWGWLDPEEDTSSVRSLIRHPAAGARLWTDILSETGHFKLRKAVLRLQRARQNEEVRKRLAETTSGKLLATLCRASRGEELQDYFHRLSRHDPVRALNLFDANELPHFEDLEATEAFRYLVERLAEEDPERAIQYMEKATVGSPWVKHLTPRSTWWGVLFDGLIAADPPRARQMLQRGRKTWLGKLPYNRQEALRKVLRAYCDMAPEEVIRRLERNEDWWVSAAGDETGRIRYLRRAYRTLCHQGGDERRTADRMLSVWRGATGGTRGWMAHLEPEDFAGQIRHGHPGHVDTVLHRRPGIVNDDAARSLLIERAKTAGGDFLVQAASGANTTAFRQLFQAALEIHERYAVRMLANDEMVEGRKGLSAEDLVPLLSSEDREVRTIAMLAVNEVGAGRSTEGSEPTSPDISGPTP